MNFSVPSERIKDVSYSLLVRDHFIFFLGFYLEDPWMWAGGLSFLNGQSSWETQKKMEAAALQPIEAFFFFFIVNESQKLLTVYQEVP